MRRSVWQAAFLLTATTWLFAPQLNTLLYPKTAMISDYKMPGQPYFWLFSLGDALAGLLVWAVAQYIRRNHSYLRVEQWALIAIGALMIVDSLAPTTCHIETGRCVNYWSLSLVIHGIESVSLGIVIFVMSLRHALKNKSTASLAFVAIQIINACIFVVALRAGNEYGTITQYVYQLLTALWLAWWIGELLPGGEAMSKLAFIRPAFAAWMYCNGALAIGYGLLPHHLVAFVDTLYFAGDTAWLAQHNVLTGLVMLYVSRQLWKGEYRARYIALTVLFLETLKFSIITPRPALAVVYGLSMISLFCLKDFYQRGSERLSWHDRMNDALVLFSGLAVAMLIPLFIYSSDPAFARVVRHASRALYASGVSESRAHVLPLRSTLMVHTVHALFGGFVLLLLWAIFRPSGRITQAQSIDVDEAHALLMGNSTSTEDYFKLWPEDKYYFWNQARSGFVAYKIAGTVAYALADPIAPTDTERAEILQEFAEHCESHGYICCFLIVGDDSLGLYTEQGFKYLQVGASARIEVGIFATETIRNKWWRWQMNRGAKQGYEFQISLPPHSQQLLAAWRTVSDAWLTRPGHREQGFAMGYFDEEYLQHCTVYYVSDSEQGIVAFANDVPAFKNLDQKTVDLIRFRPDANNAMQFLLASILQEHARDDACTYFDLGFVPLANTDTQIAKVVRILGRGRFSAEGLEQFKNKFEPEWRKNYIVYSGDFADLATITMRLNEAMEAKGRQ